MTEHIDLNANQISDVHKAQYILDKYVTSILYKVKSTEDIILIETAQILEEIPPNKDIDCLIGVCYALVGDEITARPFFNSTTSLPERLWQGIVGTSDWPTELRAFGFNQELLDELNNLELKNNWEHYLIWLMRGYITKQINLNAD